MKNGRIEVYYNLHRSCLSYRYPGKKIRHAEAILLSDATFAVQPAGLARARREQRRNVHAYIRGLPAIIIENNTEPSPLLNSARFEQDSHARLVTYNPFRAATFTYVDTGEPATNSTLIAIFANKTIWDLTRTEHCSGDV